LNGALLVRRADLLAIGGYDERVQTYGWDDEDLFRRLVAAGAAQRALDYGCLRHVPHGDRARAQAGVRFVGVEIDVNALLLEALPPWSAALAAAGRSEYAVGGGGRRRWRRPRVGGGGGGGGGGDAGELTATRVPADVRALTAPPAVARAWALALGRRLHDEWEVPWDLLATTPTAAKERLLGRLIARSAAAAAGAPRPRLLVVHVQHGLGNRLRAFGSAAAYAASTGRELVVVWQADAHIAAAWTDLFDGGAHVVLPAFLPKWPDVTGGAAWDAAWGTFAFHNYMEMDGGGAVKGHPIPHEPTKSLYYKGAYVMEPTDGALATWADANAAIRSLTPVPAVAAAVAAHMAAGLPRRVGVHVRAKSLSSDIAGVPDAAAEYGAAATATLQRWRAAASVPTFVAEMRAAAAAAPGTTFYVAADSAAAAAALRAAFPGAVDDERRACDGRDAACVRHALVDLLCLARTRALLGSNWSSFTEAAVRLGAPPPRLGGTDWGGGAATGAAEGGAAPAAAAAGGGGAAAAKGVGTAAAGGGGGKAAAAAT